jgi:aminoglycoside/choline kinase family phosphotransferase
VDRIAQIQEWLDSLSSNTYSKPEPASSDASFRRYFRVTDNRDNSTRIVMDAPPEHENCKPFIQVTELLRQVDVNAPDILAMDLTHGFLLIEDLGSTPYLEKLNERNAEQLYIDAIDALIRMQTIEGMLPAYDEAKLQAEMDLFEQWYVNRHLGKTLSNHQRSMLKKIFWLLIDNAVTQPQVFVHRDYHSRNLMVTDKNNPGVIDYQDAVIGPITYDLVSLFKDCYIEWPREQVEHWLDLYLARLTPTYFIEKPTLLRWFDLMGVQRHLKVLGIFARLNYRDGKSQYLDDLPLTRKYVLDACDRYPDLAELKQLLLEIGQ